MRIVLYLTGKTSMPFVEEGVQLYLKRLLNYAKLEVKVLPAVKNASHLSPNELKRREGEVIIKSMESNSCNMLLDERAKDFTSVQFADFLQSKINQGTQSIGFYIGGAWGFDEMVRSKADGSISLSRMTFSHQLVRVLFMEQLYRAFTIMRNEPYHNA